MPLISMPRNIPAGNRGRGSDTTMPFDTDDARFTILGSAFAFDRTTRFVAINGTHTDSKGTTWSNW